MDGERGMRREIGWICKLPSVILVAPPSLRARAFVTRILVMSVLEAIKADVSVGHFSKKESRVHGNTKN